jgi:hypothetical protein
VESNVASAPLSLLLILNVRDSLTGMDEVYGIFTVPTASMIVVFRPARVGFTFTSSNIEIILDCVWAKNTPKVFIAVIAPAGADDNAYDAVPLNGPVNNKYDDVKASAAKFEVRDVTANDAVATDPIDELKYEAVSAFIAEFTTPVLIANEAVPLFVPVYCRYEAVLVLIVVDAVSANDAVPFETP